MMKVRKIFDILEGHEPGKIGAQRLHSVNSGRPDSRYICGLLSPFLKDADEMPFFSVTVGPIQ